VFTQCIVIVCELIPHINLMLKVIALELFLDMVSSSPADNVTTHTA